MAPSMKWKIIAGTGHRPDKLGGYADQIHQRLCVVAGRWIVDNYNEIDYVISGMALGWDMALAQACFDLGMPFEAYVPFKGQESKWPRYAVQRYNFLLDKARGVKHISSPGYSGLKMHLRNEAMVNDCTHVLALYNGEKTGGTFACVEYAKKQNKPVINLWERWVGQP